MQVGRKSARGNTMKTGWHDAAFWPEQPPSFSAFAEIEEACELFAAGRFEEVREVLWPAARSGNADAEELISVMNALGLGMEKDEMCVIPQP